METVTSKKSLNFYLAVLGTIMFCGGLAATFLFFFFYNYNSESFDNRYYLLLILTISVIGFGFNVIKQYLIHSAEIVIFQETIRINNKVYQLKDIISFRPTGKSKLDFLIWGDSECARIKFNDGTTKYIVDNLFENVAELKICLQQKLYVNFLNTAASTPSINAPKAVNNTHITLPENDASKNDSKPLSATSVETVFDDNFNVYKGNITLNIRQLSLIMLIILFLYILVKNPSTKGVLILGVFLIPFVYFTSKMLYYIGISNTHLLLKNHNFFWLKQLYPLQDISEVVFETFSRNPNGIRIIFKDFNNKLFYASSLTDKQWLELKKVLEKKNIAVRNEAIPD